MSDYKKFNGAWHVSSGGEEFLVNSYTLGSQRLPAVATGASGSFVVVWQSEDQDGSVYSIQGQHFDSAGNPLGDEFQVNSYTTGSQERPAVTADEQGNFVVVWQGGSAYAG